MFIVGLVCFLFILFMDYNLLARLREKLKRLPSKNEGDEVEDEDVARHRKNIEEMYEGGEIEEPLMTHNLSKVYGFKKAATKYLTFSVNRGECFGLLGVNGAGKTSTFKMLTSEISPTGGNAWINRHSVISSMDKARQAIGFCPQFDALYPKLTAREHLEFYCKLKGLSKESIESCIKWSMEELSLSSYEHILSETYSGGNKRKLSTAISLVGGPSIVFLDEPTAGMDPGARRTLWNCVLELTRQGKSVILTSHSMEECQALCTRAAIMVEGSFKCLGSIQHLKNRFGAGYTLMIRVKNGFSADELKEMVTLKFQQFFLKEEHHNQLTYEFPKCNNTLPEVFKIFQQEKMREGSAVENFSVSQPSLDDVFVHFASNQSAHGTLSTSV